MKEKNVFVALSEKAKTVVERVAFEKMISMMLCLRKYERLKSLYENQKRDKLDY